MTGSSSVLRQHAEELPLNLPSASSQKNAFRGRKFQSDAPTEATRGAAISPDCWKVRRQDRPRSLGTLGLTAINAFGLLLMLFFLFICPAVKNHVVEGMQSRRLAEDGLQGDKDLSSPSTPELLNLCIELEDEVGPGESLPEALLASFWTVESLLDDSAVEEKSMLKAGPATSAGSSHEKGGTPPSSSFSRKRPASEDTEHKVGVAVPIGKAAKQSNTPPPPEKSAAKGVFSLFDDKPAEASTSHPLHYPSIGLADHHRVGLSSPETQRASPLMVQAFFHELEAGAESEREAGPIHSHNFSGGEKQVPFSSSFSKSRAEFEEDDTEWLDLRWTAAEEVFTSSAYPRAAKTAQVSDAYSVAIDISHHPLSSSSPYSLGSQDVLEFVRETLEHSESTSVPPSSDEGVSPLLAQAPSSLAQAPVDSSSDPTENGGLVHPWVRVPALETGAAARPLVAMGMISRSFFRTHSSTMLRMRELLRKPVLDQNDLNGLVMYAEFLVNNALQTMRAPVKSRRPADAAEALARRFLVFYLLHLTSKAVRQVWQEQSWWKELADAIPTECPFADGTQRMTSAGAQSVSLAMQLSAAIQLYKNRSAPADAEVVAILRKIFCSVHAPYHLRKKLWDPWRQDDESAPS
ncbi:hypothetical protein ACSSS7_005409 [Eimeria intestinalis]